MKVSWNKKISSTLLLQNFYKHLMAPVVKEKKQHYRWYLCFNMFLVRAGQQTLTLVKKQNKKQHTLNISSLKYSVTIGTLSLWSLPRCIVSVRQCCSSYQSVERERLNHVPFSKLSCTETLCHRMRNPPWPGNSSFMRFFFKSHHFIITEYLDSILRGALWICCQAGSLKVWFRAALRGRCSWWRWARLGAEIKWLCVTSISPLSWISSHGSGSRAAGASGLHTTRTLWPEITIPHPPPKLLHFSHKTPPKNSPHTTESTFRQTKHE